MDPPASQGRVSDVALGHLDALVAHRLLVAVIVGDPTAGSSRSVCRVRTALPEFRDRLALGTGGGLDHRIRAASALARRRPGP